LKINDVVIICDSYIEDCCIKISKKEAGLSALPHQQNHLSGNYL
jgi:hypothetical protein